MGRGTSIKLLLPPALSLWLVRLLSVDTVLKKAHATCGLPSLCYTHLPLSVELLVEVHSANFYTDG